MTHRTAGKTASRGRPFEPGEDPRRNLGGRPQAKEANKLIAEIWDEAVRDKSRGELLIRSLFALAADKDKSIRLRAIQELLDRRLGRPTQALDIRQLEVPKVIYVESVASRYDAEGNLKEGPAGELLTKKATE